MLYQLSYRGTWVFELMARMTGFEPAASGVTGRRSKPLSYTREQEGSMTSGGPKIKDLPQTR
jgi:hypothetical protein